MVDKEEDIIFLSFLMHTVLTGQHWATLFRGKPKRGKLEIIIHHWVKLCHQTMVSAIGQRWTRELVCKLWWMFAMDWLGNNFTVCFCAFFFLNPGVYSQNHFDHPPAMLLPFQDTAIDLVSTVLLWPIEIMGQNNEDESQVARKWHFPPISYLAI